LNNGYFNGAIFMKHSLIKQVQVNIPYRMFREGYLEKFLKFGLNPEIGFDAGTLDSMSISDAETVAEQLHRAGHTITLHGPFMDLSPGSPDPEIQNVTRKRFDQLAALASVFKPKTVVCHTGYDRKRYWPIKELWMEKSLELWNPLAKSLKGKGTRLMLENVYEKEPSEILPLIENLQDHGVGFCLDIGHQAVFGSVSLNQWVQTMSFHLQQLHLHDNDGKQDDHFALGAGTINIENLLSQLHSMRVQPLAVTLEPHKEDDLAPSLEYLQTIWPW
jgi:sugar phosphate isomerase/epimerase